MNNLNAFLKEKDIHPLSFTRKGKVLIILDNNKRIVIKENTNNFDIYKYLLSRKFDAFPKCLSDINDLNEITEYIDNINIPKDQRVNDLLILLSSLHFKTSYSKELEINDINKLYNELKRKIKDTKKYYVELNDQIDKTMFLSPFMYLLVRNISLFYYILDKAYLELNSWKEEVVKKRQVRYALNHNNISCSHLLVNNRNYLISWDKASFSMPIDDLESFYRKYYSYMELKECFKIYETYNEINDLEKKLLLIRISIPKIINLKNNYIDTKLMRHEIDFLKKIYQYYNIKDK